MALKEIHEIKFIHKGQNISLCYIYDILTTLSDDQTI
jgi:hypothetical protein